MSHVMCIESHGHISVFTVGCLHLQVNEYHQQQINNPDNSDIRCFLCDEKGKMVEFRLIDKSSIGMDKLGGNRIISEGVLHLTWFEI